MCCSLKHAEISISGGESHSEKQVVRVWYLQRGSQWELKETGRIQREIGGTERERERDGGVGGG